MGGICTTLHSNARAARVTIVAYSDSAVKDNFVGVILWGGTCTTLEAVQ